MDKNRRQVSSEHSPWYLHVLIFCLPFCLSLWIASTSNFTSPCLVRFYGEVVILLEKILQNCIHHCLPFAVFTSLIGWTSMGTYTNQGTWVDFVIITCQYANSDDLRSQTRNNPFKKIYAYIKECFAFNSWKNKRCLRDFLRVSSINMEGWWTFEQKVNLNFTTRWWVWKDNYAISELYIQSVCFALVFFGFSDIDKGSSNMFNSCQ